MDLEDVKVCLRALLSSTAYAYYVNNLLNDFKNITGFDLPLFGCLNAVQFLRTLNDTVQIFGDPRNPQIALIESKKSAHITSLVDKQKKNAPKFKFSQVTFMPKRVVVPNNSEVLPNSGDGIFRFTATHSQRKGSVTSQPIFKTNPRQTNTNDSVSVFLPSFTSFNTDWYIKPKQIESLEVIKNDVIVPKKTDSDLVSSQDVQVKTENSPTGSPKDKKTDDTSNLKDVSDSTTTSSSYSYVNDGVKNKLKILIKKHPEGLWCCELPALFLEEYKYELDYREFGYTSLIQMISELPEIFRCVRPGNEDWILFDASIPSSSEEKKMIGLQLTSDFNCEIKTNMQKLLLNQSTFESGVELDSIPELYEKMFGKSLDFKSLGFENLKSLFEAWEGKLLNIFNVNGKTIISHALTKSPRPKLQWAEAVPPITEKDDLFCEIFPKEVVGPEERLIEIDLVSHLAAGHVIKVCVAEVWSPSKFYVQLNKYKSSLNRFMDDLQKFYNVYLNKYKMPDSTIRPNQVCVGLYNSDPDYPDEWHRAVIIKVINEKIVLVNFVDYGTVTRVKKTQLRFLHRNFYSFPIQGFLAKLSGVAPPNDEKVWPVKTSKKFLEYLRIPNLDAKIIDVDFKKPSMELALYESYKKPETNISEKLISDKLAKKVEPLNENPVLRIREDEMKAPGVNSSDLSRAQQSSDENIPEKTDAFSDIDDLTKPTMFHFKMKALKIEDSSPTEKKNEKAPEKSNVVYEFEEVPDLESNCEKTFAAKMESKDSVKSNLTPASQKSPSRISQTEAKKEFNLQFPQPKLSLPEQNIPFSTEKAKRCPPGLEHVYIPPNYSQIQFLLQSDEIRKRINILALELLSTNPSIKEVGLIDPTLALKIASEMAQAYVRSEYATKLPFEFNSMLTDVFINGLVEPPPSAYEAKGPVVPVVPVMPVSPPVMKIPETTISVTNTINTTSSSETVSAQLSSNTDKKKDTYVTTAKIGEKIINLVVINKQFYCGAEEIVRTFTFISSREVADRVLHLKKTPIEYKIISKKSDESAYNAIKSSSMGVVKKKKKMKFYLIPLKMVLPFLQALGCFIKSFENDIMEILKTEGAQNVSPDSHTQNLGCQEAC